MPDTQYTKGFRAGFTWERERITKLLKDDYWHHLSYLPRLITDKPTIEHHKECLGCQLITIIEGETNG